MATCTAAAKQAAYVLPAEMIRAIKRAAADHDVYPAKIVERACGEYLAYLAKQPKRDRVPA